MEALILMKANKKNKLGGVKTPEGKNISRLNAVKHGFFSELITEHDKISHKTFSDAMYDLIEPKDIFQTELLEILLSNFLSYRRIALLESRMIKHELENAITCNDPYSLEFGETSYQIKFKESIIDELIKFQRYKTSALNSIIKTKKAIDNSQ